MTSAIEVWQIDKGLMNDGQAIELRVAGAASPDRAKLRSALRYLYMDTSGTNLSRKYLKSAEPYLKLKEKIVIRWLYTRTNGCLRRAYGAQALLAAKAAKYRCENCGFADVRTLNIDHVHGRVKNTKFACLCANCHAIKSRRFDWSGTRRAP